MKGADQMIQMKLNHLQVFLAVAENLHFSRAAEELRMSQPAVSAAIQSLEELYQVKLFHRIGRQIQITEAGKLLHMEAQKIFDQVALTERSLRELNEIQRGELHLGVSLTIGNYWLPDKISHFHSRYPGISFNCTLANTETICARMATGEFDLGLVEGKVQPSLKSYLEEEVVGSDRILIVVGKSHPWFERAEVPLTELTKTEWVMREPGSGTQQRFEEALQYWGIDPLQLPVILVLSSGEMVKTVVESGIGAAAISEMMVKKELDLSTLRSVTVIDNRQSNHLPTEILRPFLKLKHRDRFQSKLFIAFEQILTS